MNASVMKQEIIRNTLREKETSELTAGRTPSSWGGSAGPFLERSLARQIPCKKQKQLENVELSNTFLKADDL